MFPDLPPITKHGSSAKYYKLRTSSSWSQPIDANVRDEISLKLSAAFQKCTDPSLPEVIRVFLSFVKTKHVVI